MALSNWDTLAINEKGENTIGSLTTPLGVEVSIYKNWLYIRDAKGWEEGGNYVEPTVMEIQEGVLTYKDLHITAIRGPQEGVFVFAHYMEYGDDKENIPDKFGAMIGCGVYGYRNIAGEFLESKGIEIGEHDLVSTSTRSWEKGREWVHILRYDAATDEYKRPEEEYELPKELLDEDPWVGVDKESVAFLKDKYKEWRREALHRNQLPDDLLEGELLRFNQGDAYISDRIGAAVPATLPGEQEPTMMSQVLKEWAKQPEESEEPTE